MTAPVDVFGAPSSVYVRSVRLALEEKGVAYQLHPVDVFALGDPPADQLARHPFGKIPSFRHGDFQIYETGAILRYVDEAFDGPSLQPPDLGARTRMNQILAILDNYAYRCLVWDIYVERVERPRQGIPSDEVRIASALGLARTILAELERLSGSAQFLLGAQLTLADLHGAPMFALFTQAEESGFLLEAAPGLARWWTDFSARNSVVATAPEPAT